MMAIGETLLLGTMTEPDPQGWDRRILAADRAGKQGNLSETGMGC